MSITIAAESTDTARPYAHLLPIVEALIAAGNAYGPRAWHQDRDGWRCDLQKPIDFRLVRERFTLPPTVKLAEADDAILCRRTFIEISGSAAKAKQQTKRQAP